MSWLVNYLRRVPVDARLQKTKFKSSLRLEHVQAQADALVETIQKVLEEFFAASLDTIREVDVAEFFTVAQTLAETPDLFDRSGFDGQTLRHQRRVSRRRAGNTDARDLRAGLYADLAAATRSLFADISHAITEATPDIRLLLKSADPDSDVFVSFNWDEELDIALNRLNDVSYTFPDWQHNDGYLILKPHGSIGWYDVAQGLGNDDLYFIANDDYRIPRIKRRVVGFIENELPHDVDGLPHDSLGCPPIIMPPTFAKQFRYPEQQCIWQDVLHVCGAATEFVFLGYSLASDDFLTRAAIRSARRQRHSKLRCLIVDREFSERLLGNFQTVFSSGLTKRRNFLAWTFGDAGRRSKEHVRLAKEIETRLKEAFVRP